MIDIGMSKDERLRADNEHLRAINAELVVALIECADVIQYHFVDANNMLQQNVNHGARYSLAKARSILAKAKEVLP